MKYNYDAELECFVREDGLGKKIWINSSEAQRVVTMKGLGYSVGMICAKISFNSGRVSESTISAFLKNVDEGNIIVDGDYPAPKEIYRDLTVDDKYDNLNERIIKLEEDLDEFKRLYLSQNSVKDKVKSWLRQ